MKHLEEKVLSVLKEVHPYEEIAYEIKTIENVNENIGMGMYGELKVALSENDFFKPRRTFNKKDLINEIITTV